MYFVLYPFKEIPTCSDITISTALICSYLEKQQLKPFPVRFSFYDNIPPYFDLGKKDNIIILGDSYPESWVEKFLKITPNVTQISYGSSGKTLSQLVWEKFYPLQSEPDILKFLKYRDLNIPELPDRMRVEISPENFAFCDVIRWWISRDAYEFADIEAAKYLIRVFQKTSIKAAISNLGNKILKQRSKLVGDIFSRFDLDDSAEPILLKDFEEYLYPLVLERLLKSQSATLSFYRVALCDGLTILVSGTVESPNIRTWREEV